MKGISIKKLGLVALLLVVASTGFSTARGYGGGDTVSVTTSTNIDGTKSGDIVSAVNATETTSSGDVTLDIPAGTTVTGPAGWTGDITMPTITTTSVEPVPGRGFNNVTIIQTIDVGFGDSTLTFNKGVRLAFSGQAGNSVGFSHGTGTFTPITAICSGDNQTVGDALADGADCKIDAGSDLVVWTKHFSQFTTYMQGRRSSGGSYIRATPAVPGVSPAIPSQGRVLGAATFNFTRTMQVGSTGDDVKALQEFLTSEGVYSGPITGYFGGLTQAGVRAYQKKYGIQQVGIVGPMTRARLNSAVSNPSGTSIKQTLTNDQVTAIINLLKSFNAEQSVIDNVTKSLGN